MLFDVFSSFSGSGRRNAEVEASMPLFLRSLAMLLDMRIPFADALREASKNGAAGNEFAAAVEEIRLGAGVSAALAKVAERSGSGAVKKAAAQIISAYEHGAGGEAIRRIAEDMFSLQKYRMRDFISKSSLFGLLFVVFAAVVPTLFVVIATVGKAGIGIEVEEGMFTAAFVIGFPAVDALILAVSSSQMPPAMHSRRKNRGLVVAFALCAALLAGVMLLGLDLELKAGAAIAVSAGAWVMFGKEYAEAKRIEKLEAALPDALLSASGLPKSHGVERVFERLAEEKNDFAPEAQKTLRQLRANVSPENALEDLWKRNGSFMLRRMGELMAAAHTAGANVSEKMHEFAEDLLAVAELRRERENALSMQKYTLLLGAIVVPVILGASLSLVSQVSSFLENGASGVLETAPRAVAAYVVLYSAISALYISEMEGRNSRLAAYFAAMALCGLAGFYILSHRF